MRYRPRLDATHKAVVAALREIGCSVTSLAAVGGGCPDLLCGIAGRTVLLEVKSAKTVRRKKRETTTPQDTWVGSWRGGLVAVVHSVEEALDAIER